VAVEDPMRNQPVWRALRLHLLRCLTESERLGLGENVGQQDVMMPAKRIEWLRKRNEVARDQPSPLMNQLIKGVLSVCAWFAPVDGTSVASDSFPIERDVLSVALHRQLLEIC